MLRLGPREFGAHEPVIMAIVNRTPDSFYDQGSTFHDEPALTRVEQAVAEGAAIIDIGGVKAGPGDEVSALEEARRTVGFVAEVRRRFPDVVISVDTWRHDVGEAVCEAGADVLNDAWGGVDPKLAEVAARYGKGLVCTRGRRRAAYAPAPGRLRRRDGGHPRRDSGARRAGRGSGGPA